MPRATVIPNSNIQHGLSDKLSATAWINGLNPLVQQTFRQAFSGR